MSVSVKALLNAAGRGDAALVEGVLKSEPSRVLDEDGSRTTALHRAAAGGHVRMVRGCVAVWRAWVSLCAACCLPRLCYCQRDVHMYVWC